MADELFCPHHGPYDASHGTCPYCRQQGGARPVNPAPLEEDDLPTEVDDGPNAYYGGGHLDDEPTDLGFGSRGGRVLDDDTELPDDPAGVTELDPDLFETGTLGLLWVKKGRGIGRIYRIEDNMVIGRESGSLTFEDDILVSNPHAKFKLHDDQFVITDFDTKNGTWVNGERIDAKTTLQENDEIKIGGRVFVLKVLAPSGEGDD